MRSSVLLFALPIAALAVRLAASADEVPPTATPLGLPEAEAPADNPTSPERIALGKLLFFDKRLSKDGSASCETCHVHEKGWTDGLPLSTKVGGGVNTRNTPTLYNVAYLRAWYWDGRAPTLEKQIEAAWKGQMGADPAAVAKTIGGVEGYKPMFQKAFGADASPETIVKALGCFVRTLRSGNSPWDRYEHGDKAAVSEDAIAGYKLFTGAAHCSLCHAPPTYFDAGFHNVGVGLQKEKPDQGRGAITKDPKEMGAFKTPGLRSVTKTAPYFHDASAKTLEEAVGIMLKGGFPNPNLDEKLKPYDAKPEEVAQILAFLKALESDEKFEKPATLP